MSWKQRICALLIWSTSAYTIGLSIYDLLPFAQWIGWGLGGLLALLLILEAGRR